VLAMAERERAGLNTASTLNEAASAVKNASSGAESSDRAFTWILATKRRRARPMRCAPSSLVVARRTTAVARTGLRVPQGDVPGAGQGARWAQDQELIRPRRHGWLLAQQQQPLIGW